MKVMLRFDLPEDQNEYDVIMQAKRSQAFLWDFSQQLRNWYKYHHDFTDANDALHKIRDEFYRLLTEHNIDIDL